MKIREFSVFRYGPVSVRDRINLDNFNLLFGYNEEGKTLTIDAVVKMLLGKSSRGFDRINRVDEMPEGYVIVEREEDGDFKLPEAGNLTDITGLTASECRNIFIIRDSDLTISREGEFYKDITNRLVGLQTEEIARIVTELRHLGCLTLKGDYQDTSPHKLKTRLNKAAGLTELIDDKMRLIEETGFEKLEEELLDIETALEQVEDELELYEDARKRDVYIKGKEAIEALQNALDLTEEYSAFNREDEQQWQQCETNLSLYADEKKKNTSNIEEEQKKSERLQKSKETEEFFVHGLTRDKKQIEEHLKPKINDYETMEKQVAERKSGRAGRLLTFAGPPAVLLFVLSIAGLVFLQGTEWIYAPALLSLFTAIIYGGFLVSLKNTENRMEELLTKITGISEKLKIKAETPGGILEKINDFDRNCAEREKKILELDKNIALCRQKIETIRENIKGIEDKTKEANRIIETIKEKTGTATLNEYRSRLKIKEENETKVKTREGVLTSLFGAGGESPALQKLSFWNEKVSAVHEFAGKAEGVEFDDMNNRVARERRDALRNRRQEQGYELEKYRKGIESLGREANECLAMENGQLTCQTVKDLIAAREKLNEFIRIYEKNSEYARESINILESIGEQEEKKVQDLFGSESLISRYFALITDNLYSEVFFNHGKGTVEVLRSDGTRLEAYKLSGGAFDQLYLCIRLSLGEKLLQGEKGFFILDDPFLKADARRLKNQLEVLRRIADDGWQVIFFTAKDEVKNALQEEIEQGRVNFVQMS